MTSSNLQNHTYPALLDHLSGGEIGRLTTEEGSNEISVYVMYGGVVGALAPDDDRHIVRRLRLDNHLTSAQALALDTVLKAKKPLINFLLDMLHEETLQSVLYERYLENITRFLSATGDCQYEKLQAVFIDNLQMGHDADTILPLCIDTAQMAAELDPNSYWAATRTLDVDPITEMILELFGSGRNLSVLIDEIPLSPLAAKAKVIHLVRAGLLIPAVERDTPDEEPEVVGQQTVFTDVPSVVDQRRSTILNQRITVHDTQPQSVQTTADQVVSADSEHWEDPIVEEPTEELDPVERTVGAGDLTSRSDWLEHGEDDDVDVMEAFQDYDSQRGVEQGSFSSAPHHLDRIDVGSPDNEDEVIAVSDGLDDALFSAPDAQHKLDVANDVLKAVATAFDNCSQAPSGQSALNTLLKNSSRSVQAVLVNVTCDPSGKLSSDTLLDNLQKRPLPEQRGVLHESLLVLIEEALSLAADELPSPVADQILEAVQGYRTRLGN